MCERGGDSNFPPCGRPGTNVPATSRRIHYNDFNNAP
jgi:hypothetical protein